MFFNRNYYEIFTFFDWWLRFCKCRTWPARPKPPMLARICSECLWLGGRCILFSIWAGRRWASTTLVRSILWWRSRDRSRHLGTRRTSRKRIRPSRLVKRGRMLGCRCWLDGWFGMRIWTRRTMGSLLLFARAEYSHNLDFKWRVTMLRRDLVLIFN